MESKKNPSISKSFISSPDQIPSLPGVAIPLIHAVLDETFEIESLTEKIKLDPALASRILKISNSALFGCRSPVLTIPRAIAVLGRRILRNIILTSAIFDTFRSGDKETFRAFWKHSIGCALACEWFCSQNQHLPDKEECFLGGLLHDLGKLIIYSQAPSMLDNLLEKLADQSYIDQRNTPPLMLENEVWHVDHTIVGKWTAEKWGLPEEIINCIWLHHQPFTTDGAEKTLPRIVRFVDSLCNVYGIGENYFSNSNFKLGCHLHYTNTFNMAKELWEFEESDIRAFLSYVYTKMGEYAQLLEKEADSKQDLVSILCDANLALGQMHIEAEAEQTRLYFLEKYVEALSSFVNHCTSQPWVKTLALATWEFFSHLAAAQELVLYFSSAPDGMVYLYKVTREEISERILNPKTEAINLDTVFGSLNRGDEVRENLKEAYTQGKAFVKKTHSPSMTDTTLFTWTVPLFLTDVNGGKSLAGGAVCQIAENPETTMNEARFFAILDNFSGVLSSMLTIITSLEKISHREEKLSTFSSKLEMNEERMINQQRLALIGQLATGAAHEINNPLAVISVKAQMLEKKISKEDSDKFIQVILGQTDRIAKITSDLMNFACPTKPKKETIHLRDILGQVESVINARVSLKGILFNVNIPADLPLVFVDSKQIEQVLINLVINARHALEKKGEINIGTEVVKNYVIISVTDNGTGIKTENLPKIFDPFFTTKTEGKGTGLGLPISQRIVEINGGKIIVESEEGKGTSFHVWLPIGQSPALSDVAKKYTDKKDTASKKKHRILVVEDEQYLREVLKENLSNKTTDVDAAEDGLVAVDLLKETHYDVAILDLVMPRMNGVELIGWLFKNVRDLPIIVISAVASEEEAKKLLKLGVRKFIKKPFKIKDIISVVDEIC